MSRGITFRTLLVGLTLVCGLLVLFLALSGASDAVRDAGTGLGWAERSALMRSLLSTQLVRGLIGLAIALVLASVVAGALSGTFRSVRTTAPARARQAADAAWLQEARDLADSLRWTLEEQRRQLELLERQRGDLDRLVEAVSEGILHIDASGRIVRANRAARRLLALPEDAEGRQLATVVRSAELRRILQHVGSGGTPGMDELMFEDRTLVVSASALPSVTQGPATGPAAEDGVASGLAVAIADLTALRRLEGVRRDFVANASHELKTPLTSIRGYAETLLDDELPPETRRRFIETIHGNADRLQRVVDDLLDLSRLESGRWQPQLAPVEAAAIARAVWRTFEERAHERGIAFRVVAEDAAGDVMADPSALEQIFANLYDNALRYTDDGDRIEVRVIATAGPASQREDRPPLTAIEVSDTGAGIPGDALPRIFERFYRVDPARSRAEGGTGLGLSIVKHLAESMAGSVDARSLLGRGTTIRVMLPTAATAGATPSADA